MLWALLKFLFLDICHWTNISCNTYPSDFTEYPAIRGMFS